MRTTTNVKRRLGTLLLVGALSAALVPLAQAGYDPNRVADSVDAARAAQRPTGVSSTQSIAQSGYGPNRVADSVDAARAAQRPTGIFVQPGYGSNRVADSVEAAQAARESSSLSSMPDVVERTAAAGYAQYAFPTTSPSSGFDWGDFGIGAGAGIGLMLLLLGVGAGVLFARHGRTRLTTA